MPHQRVARTALTLGAAVLATLLTSATANSAPGPDPQRTRQITLGAEPDRLDLVPLPCFPSVFQATMTNTGPGPVYADTLLSADAPLTLSRDIFSSYLPATDPDQPVGALVEVRAPRDTPPGTYDVRLELDRQRLRVPVSVQSAPSKGPGDNLALGEEAFASSTHGNFSVCGGVDGNTDHADWDTRTGWNDGTAAVFPDTYGVRLPEPRRIDEVKVLTLDRPAHPAARYGLRDWDVQALTDGRWTTVAEVRGNTSGLVTSRFRATTAEAVRIVVHASNDARYSRVMEIEVRGS
ncbi:hypothetical protein [Streptomyces sp. TRM68367]|uniref:galactose-binding domain-containing protein n=1 Tax=Streptomyces sp. TRM68367 TaxID=2758415 RepID=UPI00165B16AC|nr:hypothetical protein [Streptomyces sp. TRM68367]MBC9727847.1 hypothetical protein [Streptomyces sp. TRM68367]